MNMAGREELALMVNDQISVPHGEFQFEYVRSGGPGGQNVNKVASKAVLRWTPGTSPSLPEPVLTRLLATLRTRLTLDGDLIVASQRTRDRARNVDDCLEKLRRLILAAANPPKPRRPTRPTRASQIRRGEQKAIRSERKRARRRPQID
jgi:ribosome-associated protein